MSLLSLVWFSYPKMVNNYLQVELTPPQLFIHHDISTINPTIDLLGSTKLSKQTGAPHPRVCKSSPHWNLLVKYVFVHVCFKDSYWNHGNLCFWIYGCVWEFIGFLSALFSDKPIYSSIWHVFLLPDDFGKFSEQYFQILCAKFLAKLAVKNPSIHQVV